jgi:hypothetical protein
MFALAKLASYTGEGPPYLLAQATMYLAATYSDLDLFKQALVHASAAVSLSQEFWDASKVHGAHRDAEKVLCEGHPFLQQPGMQG